MGARRKAREKRREAGKAPVYFSWDIDDQASTQLSRKKGMAKKEPAVMMLIDLQSTFFSDD